VNNLVRVSTSTYAVLGGFVGPLTYLGPGNVALDSLSHNFYMVQWYDNALHALSADGTSVLRSADLGTSQWQLVVDPDGSVVYVTDRVTDQVRVIDRATLTQVNAVTVGDDPWGIDITPDGSLAFVAGGDSGTQDVVYVIDLATATLSGTVPLPAGASNVNVVAATPQVIPVELQSLSVE
jgi:YVTN family beta-propeller protein